MPNIDNILGKMRSEGKLQNMKGKGDAGEDAVLAIMHEYYQKRGGLLYQSFSYPYASNRQGKVYLGNIFLQEDGSYKDVSRQYNDEIDILYVSDYRIFPIEVKAYHATITVYDSWFKKNGTKEEKSPLAQSEKHARHLYHQIYDVLPDGNPVYIRPIVCFVDECRVIDERSPQSKFYMPITILDTLKQKVRDLDVPAEYSLDIAAIEKKLNSIKKDVRLEV